MDDQTRNELTVAAIWQTRERSDGLALEDVRAWVETNLVDHEGIVAACKTVEVVWNLISRDCDAREYSDELRQTEIERQCQWHTKIARQLREVCGCMTEAEREAAAAAEMRAAGYRHFGVPEDHFRLVNDDELSQLQRAVDAGVDRNTVWWDMVKADPRGKDIANWKQLPVALWREIMHRIGPDPARCQWSRKVMADADEDIAF